MGSINARLAAHDARLNEISAPEVFLQATEEQLPGMSHATMEMRDAFKGMEDAVRRKVADRLREPCQLMQSTQMMTWQTRR